MKAPGWARLLLATLAPTGRIDEILGDLEEAHELNVRRSGRVRAHWRTTLETFDMSFALLKLRIRRSRSFNRSSDDEGRGPLPRRPATRLEGPSWLDFKLGLRMLVKHPGLTAVAGIAIAFATALGSGTGEFVSDLLYPTMPFEEGERIVQIRNRDLSTGGVDPRAGHDFQLWRESARSVVELGALVSYRRNVVTAQGTTRPAVGAEMTAAAFNLPRVPPILGRPLIEADERPGAPEVAVIGYEVWTTLFGGDADVLNSTVRVGSEAATIVGVMPEGFAYPHGHSVWTPLRLNALDYPRGEGPGIEVVGRLAQGIGLDEARSEFLAIGQRTASAFPDTNEHLRPSVVQFGRIPQLAGNWLTQGFYFAVFLGFSLLMLLVCANVALLLFARTAARESEITIRTAIGATRGRIIAQLFVEALVLAVSAAVVGLWVGHTGLDWVLGLLRSFGGGQQLGFWFDASLSTGTVIVALTLTVLAAGFAGIVPALKATGKTVQASLQRVGAGTGGARFGSLWTGVIVAQIALTVAFAPVVIVIGYQTAEIRAADLGFAAEHYLSAEVQQGTPEFARLDTTSVSFTTGMPSSFVELKRRLRSDPRVRGVAMSSHVPGANHPLRHIVIEGSTAPDQTVRRHRVATGHVDADFFEALQAPIVAGRGFRASDMAPRQNVVVVNEDFARFVLEDRNPIGRRFAYVDSNREPHQEPDEWFEIVGVVSQVAMQVDPDLDSGAGLYRPLRLEESREVVLAVRLGPNPASFSPRFQELARDVDPTLLVTGVRPMDEGAWETRLLYESWFWVIVAAAGTGLLLTLAGIYAIMAFTVSRRTREIGVRVALGAPGTRVVATILSRALKQLVAGVLLGGTLCIGFVFLVSEGSFRPGPREFAFAGAYLTMMMGVCLTACVVPVRRALAVQPTEALRDEG